MGLVAIPLIVRGIECAHTIPAIPAHVTVCVMAACIGVSLLRGRIRAHGTAHGVMWCVIRASVGTASR
jgi:hypothetical protein